MSEETNLVIKPWQELTPAELDQLNVSHSREWQISPMSKEHHGQNMFFLLKDAQDTILAQGQLVPVNGVNFNGEIFDIFGIGGIIANVKGTGYGKKIMSSIKDYLLEHHKSGVGFTGFSGFYEKCGFLVDMGVIKRFVHVVDGRKVINTESDSVCYLDSDDKFMEKVLREPSLNVLLPRSPDW